MKKISSILFLSLSLISLYPKGVKPQEIFKKNNSKKNINENKKQNLNLVQIVQMKRMYKSC